MECFLAQPTGNIDLGLGSSIGEIAVGPERINRSQF
jgi:hypothetical protein